MGGGRGETDRKPSHGPATAFVHYIIACDTMERKKLMSVGRLAGCAAVAVTLSVLLTLALVRPAASGDASGAEKDVGLVSRGSGRLRVLITGGAGFVGSHLVDRLMTEGHEVIVADNYFTGAKYNLRAWLDNPRFELIRHDVTEPLMVEVDRIYHLACPASPVHYKVTK